MSFKHLVAYGNSDQVSFRTQEVRDCLDIMTVPGTIASYYSEATVAFVLSSQNDYLIDPRTPLFQGTLEDPRASHFSLAEWHGPTVLGSLAKGRSTNFPSSFWTSAIVAEMTASVIDRQRNYAGSAPNVATKINRYAKLLADALEDQGMPAPAKGVKPPHWVLAPYFATSGMNDPWWPVIQQIWTSCGSLPNATDIVPVLCVDGRPTKTGDGAKIAGDGVTTLESLIPLVPANLSNRLFFWITNFDERKVSEAQLRRLWQVIEDRPAGRELVNMYGGYFSICLSKAGLNGFGNGLTYSESRDWPALSATGAAPLRYYVPKLHGFLPLATAAALMDIDPWFECDCPACDDWRNKGNSIASLPYHDTKRHFAIARGRELNFVSGNPETAIAAELQDAKQHLDAARTKFILKGIPNFDYLSRWSGVLLNH